MKIKPRVTHALVPHILHSESSVLHVSRLTLSIVVERHVLHVVLVQVLMKQEQTVRCALELRILQLDSVSHAQSPMLSMTGTRRAGSAVRDLSIMLHGLAAGHVPLSSFQRWVYARHVDPAQLTSMT
jgi:hypothetical protein